MAKASKGEKPDRRNRGGDSSVLGGKSRGAYPQSACPWPLRDDFVILEGPFKGREWVEEFGMHGSPHIDELAGVCFALTPLIADNLTNFPLDPDARRRLGADQRPGFVYPRASEQFEGLFPMGLPVFKYFESDEDADEYRELAREEGRNIKLFGIGKSPFNEHGDLGRINEMCCAKLVCLASGQAKRPSVSFALKRILQSDIEAKEDVLSFAKHVKRRNRYGVDTFETFLEVYRMLTLLMRESSEIHFDCPRQWQRSGKVRFSVNGYIVAAAESNLLTMQAFLRGEKVNGDVVVVMNHNGNAFIGHSTSDESRQCHAAIVREICLVECSKKGMGAEAKSHAQRAYQAALENRAMDVPGVGEVWYMTWETLLNGSEAHAKDPTRLTLEEILECITRALESVPAKTLASRQRQRLLRRLNRLNDDCLTSVRLFDQNRKRARNLLAEAVRDCDWRPLATGKGRQKVEDDEGLVTPEEVGAPEEEVEEEVE